MAFLPDSVRRGQTLTVTVSNLPLYHVALSLEFDHASGPSSGTRGSGLEVVGRKRWVPPSSYEYDVRIEPNAPLGDHAASLRGRIVRTFTVLEAIARAAADVARNPDWLIAAEEKQSTSSHLILVTGVRR